MCGFTCPPYEDNLSDEHQLRGGVYFVDKIAFSQTSGKIVRAKVKEAVAQLYAESNGHL